MRLEKTWSKVCAAWLGAAFGFLVRAAQALGVAVALPLLDKPRGMCSDRKARKWGSFLMALTARGSRLGFLLLILFALLLGAAHSAQAATVMCSQFYEGGVQGVVDGNDPATYAAIASASTFGIDMNCTIKNFPQSIGGFPITNINFQFPQQQSFYIAFLDVYYYGHMSCNDPTQSTFWIYWAPGGFNDISSSCQAFMVPVDAVLKRNPPAQTTAAIGVPFTYTITVPLMGQLDSTGTFQYIAPADDSNITNAVITDDLTTTGAALSYVSNTAYLVNPSTGTRTPLGALTLGTSSTWLANHPGVLSDGTKHLVFSYEYNSALASIPAGYNIEIDLTVVLDDNDPMNPNLAGTQFSNTAKMWFNKTINSTPMIDLQAQPGTTLPMTIVEPNLVVTKTSSMSNLNVGTQAPYTINVQNAGGSTAWNTTITDNLPAGMCIFDPRSTLTAQIFAADGVTPVSGPLVSGTDFSVSWNGGSASACQLSLQMLSAAATIGPTQRLIINYQAMLDAGIPSGTFTNVAGATQWFSAASSFTGRREYDWTLTNGTPGVLDFQDAYTITAAVAGYYFLKSVDNLTTGAYPATVAFPGDRLRYTLQIQNFNIPPLNNITTNDDLGALNGFTAFVPGSLTLAGTNLPAGTYTICSTCGTNGAGTVTINGLNLGSNVQYQIQFDVTLASNLTTGTIVRNQASLSGTDSNNRRWSGDSDDPYINGPALLGTPRPDITPVSIQVPGALSKTSPTPSTATIGQQFSYLITVPPTPISMPLYDVKILDTLPTNVSFVSAQVVSGGTWNLTNTGNATNLVIQDTNTGIDIPAGGQAVIEITVALQNTTVNASGVSFTNSATYTYDKINGDSSSQETGAAGTANITVVEPAVTAATKTVTNVTTGKQATDPAAVGDVLEYEVTIPNSGRSTAFDTNVVDTLPANVALVPGSATARINGVPVAGFVVNPTPLPSGALAWGSQNGDGSLDIPAGQSLVLTYRVTVVSVNGTPINNSVYVDWTSLDGAVTGQRTGAGCPAWTSPNNYCYGPVSATVSAVSPVLNFTKTVYDVTTGQSGANARPGDTLKYTLTIQNVSTLSAADFSLTDESDGLNTTAMFVPGSLTLVTVPAGANTTLTSATGGTKGTGLVSISNLSIDPQGGANDNLVIEFQATLVPVITSGSVVLNQAQIGSSTLPMQLSDDPSLSGASDPTRTLIASAPAFRVLKTVQDITSGTSTVMAGDTLRYTITVKNIGTENAVGVTLRDQIPANTTYVANTTRLNGAPVADPSAGVSVLQNGMLIHSPADLTAGAMPADASATTTNVATVTFDVRISTNVVDGTIISNQGFVNGSGAGSGPFPEQPSDNPATPVLNDPTSVIVGNLPLVYALKTVQLVVDNNNNGNVDPGDVLQYTITLTNSGATPATGVVLTDAAPANTTYVANSTTLNGAAVADPSAGVSPLANGMGVVSSGLAPPSPPSSGGTLAAGGTGIVTFDVQVNAGVSPGTIISNQGSVATTQLPTLLTDSDGNLTNGYQPTVIVVGDPQQLTIIKQVAVVGGGTAEVGDELEYEVRVTNIGTVAATNVVITDALPSQLLYVPGSAVLNGSSAGINVAGSVITADYSSVYGSLPTNGTAVLRFRATIVSGTIGTTVTNTAEVTWNTPSQNASGSASVGINGAVAITKTSSLPNVTRGSLVPYTITVTNVYGGLLNNISIVDRFPAGFKYVEGSARFDGNLLEPVKTMRELRWDNLPLTNGDHTIKLLLVVGSGVSEGEYVNQAQVFSNLTGGPVSGIATATVRVTPDPNFDCTDVIGKVFDDRNLNGQQDSGEKGLFGVRVVTARGLIATTDEYGRFHITCAAVPDEDRGSNFILKLDERSLPSGYRLTTENPRVQRATRGKMMRFNFGATIHRVVRIDVADGAFEPNTSEIRIQWRPKIAQLLEELKKAPSVLRLSYLGDVEPKGLVQERLETLKKIITEQWKESDGGYRLIIETEIFWRRGAPVATGPETWTRETDAPSEATEMHLPVDQSLTTWTHDPAIFEKDEGDRTEMREVVEQDAKTIKLDNLVPPIHFGLGEAEIPDNYLKLLRNVLDSMRDRANVRLHFVGHADSLPLRGELIKIYGDNVGLSRERAGTVAEYCQRALNLPPEAISYEGLGDSRPVASNATEEGRQLNRRVEVQVWYDEISEKKTEKEVIVPREVNRIKVCRTETVCKLRYKDGHSHRARVKNLISPLQYDKGMLSVPEEFLQQVRQALTNLGGKQNLVVKFTAYTDNIPLEGRDKRIYGDPIGLSKAVARRVSLAIQEDSGLPNAAIEIVGKGASQPVASNDTQQGRALNRRVEVEFWYDDPLQDLPDEPQLCPGAPGAETVTRVYDPPSGSIDPILFENGNPVIPDGYIDTLRRIMDEIGDKTHVRLRFVGYTGNKRLDRRTAAVYGDDIGLSIARARRAMAAVSEQMGLAEGQAEFDGRGYVQSDDVVNAGFVESDTSRIEVKVVYDELIIRDDYEGVEVTPLTREVHPINPFALNLMRITVDGKPIDDPNKSSSDVQRCTDVALENAQIQFKHDGLKLEPRLNVTAWPGTIQYQDLPDTGFVENLVYFRLYTNYRSFIKRAEVRIFEEEQSIRDTPIAVVEMDADGMAQWQPEFESFSAPVHKLKYLVRVYDKKGLFDETSTQPLWVVDHIDPSVAEANLGENLLAGYGESRITIRNIPLSGGTVQAYGTAIPEGYGVWMAGYKVPVDDTGSFVAEEILPEGMHTVEVGVLDKLGNGKLFLRDLALKKSDWFTVGIADLTLSGNKTTGPAELLAPDKPQYSEDMSLQGRLAFYTNGKFENGWSLKASADTREGPLDEIFSNFLDKSPDALFRRIDPDYHYPTFGDDSTVEEDAPTLGKFYIKMKKEKTYGLWGNFKIGYTDNDLAHVDRGLYGANLHYQPLDTTSFGEPRLLLDGFAADPGTVAGRDEFRGTDGSLYFLHQQDILEGSERVRIEVRDKDSGMILGVKNLTPVLDYDIDYLQGRILLAQPLPATADDGMLVSSGSITGNPVFLVVRYEFTPGFDDPNTLAAGGRVHYWFNDHVKVGVTASRDEEADIENSLGGADLTLRKSSESWIRLETGRTKGPGLLTTTSNDGGFKFDTIDSFNNNEVKALAYRIDTSVGFKDLFKNGRGTITFYLQDLEAGYSAPGKTTALDLTQYGGTADLPVTDRLTARLKMDKQVQPKGLETEAGEVNLGYRMGEHWTLSSGVRRDSREDNSAVVPPTQEEGARTDAVARLQYDSRARWSTYGFAQETIQKSGNREDNGRIGAGGSLRLTDRFNILGEVSGGDLGTGGKLGTEYLYSDRTTLYSNYTLENERTDNGLRARKGNMASGFRTRYSDSASVYLEERYTHGDVPTGLMHSTGVDLAPTDRLNLGANLDFGTLKDHQTGAELKRTAAGLSAGYGFETLKIASALEYRVDDTEHLGKDLSDNFFVSTSKRTTWLVRNSLRYQLNPDWRLIGKFDYAHSDSSQGQFFDGEYTEAVLGYAYRPVHYDRLNALLKYTYFYNVPAAEQVTGTNTASDYIQRSHIGSIDAMYDLTPRWTVGGKYAYRYGQVAQNRANPEFFISRAYLYVLRADWHFVYRWDALFEVRRLDLPDAEDSRSGVLLGIYRHLGNHIKVGVGYNFSDFSDDLTQLDYKHQGLFINLIGTY